MKRLMIIIATALGCIGQVQAANFSTMHTADPKSLKSLHDIVKELNIGLDKSSVNLQKTAEALKNVKITADLGSSVVPAISKLESLAKTLQQGVPPINATVGINQTTAQTIEALSKSVTDLAHDGVKISHTIDPKLMRFGLGGMFIVGGMALGYNAFGQAHNPKNANKKLTYAGLAAAALMTIGGGWLSLSATL